jgi:chromosome segregation ATPase
MSYSTIQKASESLAELEEREGEAAEKETYNEEKLAFLLGQFKEAEVRAEAAERSCQVLENNISEIQSEISDWNKKIAAIDDEMAQMDADFDVE